MLIDVGVIKKRQIFFVPFLATIGTLIVKAQQQLWRHPAWSACPEYS